MLLRSNDQVAIIAPASQFRSADRELLQKAVDLLKSWSLNVTVSVASDHYFYLAGSDYERQAHLNRALIDPEIKAIFCIRGGYGCARLLRGLPAQNTVSEKLLIGHSDITSLHMAALASFPSVSCVHGPNIATRQLLDDTHEGQYNRQSLRAAIFEGKDQAFQLEFIRPGTASGRFVGGCLSILCTGIGTPFCPDLENTILFLEDVDEAPYKIDRMLQHLINSGTLEMINGLVLGTMHKCTDPYNGLTDVVLDALKGSSFPIAFGLTSGHGPINTSLRLGVDAALDFSQSALTLNSIK